ncbi:MAG: ABC transporter ATP-binding protein [Microbacterium sp.]|uniref:ABC transporter ATP-binding protein n=1 Tax=Microbacterium sp. TaxID=51671 RepID=UPI0039E4DB51
MSATVLEVDELEVAYGPIQVLHGVSMAVREGETLALLGTNGAGKSTLLKAIVGLAAATAGTIRWRGEALGAVPCERRARAGIMLVDGGHAVFPELTVADNLRAGCFSFGRDRRRVAARTDHVLELFPVLRELRSRRAGSLSGGEQQMLALAKGLLPEPRLLLIDELSLGLAPVVVGQLMQVVEQLAGAGMTIVVVEQSLNVALHLAQRAIFMEKGRVRFEGASADLLRRDDLARAVFLGAPA